MLKQGRWMIVAVVLAALVYGIACTEKAPLKVGFLGGVSGRVADLGIAGRNGAELAIEQQNSAGGVGGRKLQLLVKDDKQDAEVARKVVGELFAADVEAIIGPMTSYVAINVVGLANKSKTLLISPTTTTEELKGVDDYFMRVVSSADGYAVNLSEHVVNVKSVKNIVIVYDLKNKAYTKNWIDSFTEHFLENGGNVLAIETFTSGPGAKIQEISKSIVDKSPQAVVIAANAMDTALLCQQLRKLNATIPFFTSEWAGTEKIIELGGESVNGIVMSQFFDRDSKYPAYLEFRKAYVERYSEEPGFASIAAYDAARVLIHAFEKRERGMELKKVVLKRSTYPGVQGDIVIDEFGDASRKIFLATITDGKFKVLDF